MPYAQWTLFPRLALCFLQSCCSERQRTRGWDIFIPLCPPACPSLLVAITHDPIWAIKKMATLKWTAEAWWCLSFCLFAVNPIRHESLLGQRQSNLYYGCTIRTVKLIRIEFKFQVWLPMIMKRKQWRSTIDDMIWLSYELMRYKLMYIFVIIKKNMNLANHCFGFQQLKKNLEWQ